MLEQTDFSTERDAMEHEARRDAYPAAFPPLPEIPGGRYFDADFHRLEMQHIWHKSWLFAGHISQIPNRGDFMMFDKLGLSIVVTHGGDGIVHAFHNVCRHRGSAVTKEKFGNTSRFVCPYHAWTYGLDGRLLTVPEEQNFACLDKAKRGLINVRCENWRGLIFINIDPEADDFADMIAPVAEKVAGFPLETMKVKRIVSVELNCNWKAAVDNFIEIYHVPPVHGKTAMHWLKTDTFYVFPLARGHSFLTTGKKIDAVVEEDNTAKLLHSASPGEAPLAPGTDPFFHDNTVVVPTFPNLIFGGFNPGGFPIQCHWPIDGPDKSVLESMVIGWGDDETYTEYWDRFVADMMTQIDEDMDILANIQRSLNSGFYTGALVSYLERAIYWYHEEIDRRIGVDNVPAGMAVEPVMSRRFGTHPGAS